MDGWSNVHNETLVCMAATTTSGETFLIDCVDTKDNSHAAEYLESIAKDGIKKRVEKFQFKVCGFVTENTGNVKYWDPRYLGQTILDADDETQGLEFTAELSPDLIAVIAQFRPESLPFLKPYVEAANCMQPCDWWQLVNISDELKLQIIALHSCGSTTAPLERMFSSFGWIHNDQRNRLGAEKASKLLFCFKVLNM